MMVLKLSQLWFLYHPKIWSHNIEVFFSIQSFFKYWSKLQIPRGSSLGWLLHEIHVKRLYDTFFAVCRKNCWCWLSYNSHKLSLPPAFTLVIHKKKIARHVGTYTHIQKHNLLIMGALLRKIISFNHERIKLARGKVPLSVLRYFFSGPLN